MLKFKWLLALIATLGAVAASQGQEIDQVYKKVVKSSVYVVRSDGGSGSGSLIDLDKKYVLTNQHVVDGLDWVYILFPVFDNKGNMITEKDKYTERIPAGQALRGTVIFADSQRDLALVQLAGTIPAGCEPFKIAEKSEEPGAKVWNIGSPGAVDQLFGITSGNVRTVGPKEWLSGRKGTLRKATVLFVTNPTNPGDSGGPVFNVKGELVGVTQGGVNSKAAQAVNFSVDVSEVRAFFAEKKIEVKGVAFNKEMPKKETPKTVASDPEKAADQLLKKADLLANIKDSEADIKKILEEIVAKYPDTAAGKEAKKRLMPKQ